MQTSIFQRCLLRRTIWIFVFIISIFWVLGGCSKKNHKQVETTLLTQSVTPTILSSPSPTLSPTPTPRVKKWLPMNQEKTLYKLPLDKRIKETCSIMFMSEWYGDLLVVTSTRNSVNLYVCDLYTGYLKDFLNIEAFVSDYTSNIITKDGEYCFFNSNTHEFIYINQQLEVSRRIQVKVENDVSPRITQDGTIVYYLRYLEPSGMELVKNVITTGEEYVIKKEFEGFSYGSLGGLLFDDSVLIVSAYGDVSKSLFVDFKTFEVYRQEEIEQLDLKSKGEMFVGKTSKTLPELIYGYSKDMENTYCIAYENESECYNGTFFLDKSLLSTYYTKSTDDGSKTTYYFQFYDLNTGYLYKKIKYQGLSSDGFMNEPCVYMEEEQVLVGSVFDSKVNCIYLWDLSAAANESDVSKSYRYPYQISNEPDYETLDQLQKRADAIGDRFGVIIKTGLNCKTDFYGYQATQTYEAHLIAKTLDVLEDALEKYPVDFFVQIGDYGKKKLVIYLIKDLSGHAEGTISYAAGLYNGYNEEQFMVLNCEDYMIMEGTIYHELCHAIDAYLLRNGDCYNYGEEWNVLNPEGFEYEYTYNEENEITKEYCSYGDKPEAVYFIDMYAKTFPIEDRARLMESVLRDGMDIYKEYPHLMMKLEAMYKEVFSCFDTSNWNGDFFEFDDTFGVIQE